jgi:DNA-binding transcriptional MerR regulator
MEKTADRVVVDEEWLLLIAKAKNLGITIEEIRMFLKEATKDRC